MLEKLAKNPDKHTYPPLFFPTLRKLLVVVPLQFMLSQNISAESITLKVCVFLSEQQL